MAEIVFNDLVHEAHENAKRHGFWPERGRNFGEMLMLAVTELSEAMEEDREGRPVVWYKHVDDCRFSGRSPHDSLDPKPEGCTCTPKPEGAAVEIGDCIIRCMDTAFSLVPDVAAVVIEKMEYNKTRAMKHGKAY